MRRFNICEMTTCSEEDTSQLGPHGGTTIGEVQHLWNDQMLCGSIIRLKEFCSRYEVLSFTPLELCSTFEEHSIRLISFSVYFECLVLDYYFALQNDPL